MEPNPLAIVGLCVAGAGGLIFLLWLNHKLRTGGRPKSTEKERQTPVRPFLAGTVMSYVFGSAGPIDPVETEHRSYAVERRTEQPGTRDAERVPAIVEQLAELSDDELLDILALLPGEDGEYRYAESRVAKFIGGRVEDRLAQVRAVRGTTPPLPPGRTLRVKDERGERVIPI